MNNLYILLTVFFISIAKAQPGITAYLSDWSNAGLLEDNFKPLKSVFIPLQPDTAIPANELFIKAFETFNNNPGIIFLDAGKYLLSGTLRIPSNVMIKGKGAGKTIIYIQNSGAGHGLVVEGNITNIRAEIKPPTRGDSKLDLLETLSHPFEWIRWIREDKHLCHNNWCYNTTGQFLKVNKIKGTTLLLHDAIRDNSNQDTRHYIVAVQPAQNVFLESFTLVRLDKTESQSSNIFFNYAVNCKVTDIESYYTNYAHVEARNSAHITVAGNYFTLSHGYGGGGRGYGVMLHLGTVNCLVIDNIFETLRHSMIVQAGANGNVFAFNFSLDPRQTSSFFGIEIQNSLTGDLVLHGNYPYANLFEGNRVSMAIADNSHGASGPNNVFFKNHITRNGFSITEKNTNRVALINNYISGPLILLFGREHLDINTVTPSSIRNPENVSISSLSTSLKMMDKTFRAAYLDTQTLYGVDLPAQNRHKNPVKTSTRYAHQLPVKFRKAKRN